MSKRAEIKKIILGLDGKEVELSLDQAKELHGLLAEMFSVTTATVPWYPIFIEHRHPYWDYHANIWNDTSGGRLQMWYTAENQAVYMSL